MLLGAGRVRPDTVRPNGALVDPEANELDLFGGKLLTLQRHLIQIAFADNAPIEPAFGGVAFDNQRARDAALKDDGLHIQPQTAILLLGAVTAETRLEKDRLYVANEVDAL